MGFVFLIVFTPLLTVKKSINQSLLVGISFILGVGYEKEVPTTKVTIKVPSGLEIESYQPVPGWNYSTEKDSSGKVKTFTFAATGQGI